MKYLIFIIILIIFFNIQLTSQIVNFDIYTQLSSSTGLSDLKNFSISNPATFQSIDSGYLALSYQPSKFGLKELSQSTIFINQRINNEIVTGLAIIGTVNDIFNEFTANASIASKVYDNLDIGGSIVYNRIGIKNFSTYSAVFINFGAKLKLTNDIFAGFSLSNLLRENRTGGNENVVQIANIGVGAKIIDEFYIDFGSLISISRYSGFMIGVKYNLEKYISLRIASSSAENALEFSAMFKPNNYLEISSGLNYQNVLGYSPYIGMNYIW
jgi:hypothetical protein